ncbi:MAG: hypothetical protein JWM95_2797 [Gemmatimonadetes bacterium]|nr:hypothetical protein [Gemmatimonadota bacterium]
MRRLLLLTALGGSTLVSACITVKHSAGQPASNAAATIKMRLDSTAIGWNQGSLATYMMVYEPDASQMGSKGVEHGRDVIDRTMRAGFWKTGKPLQTLRYEDVEVRPLGEHHALVTGRFVLTGAGRPDQGGVFTTVWSNTSGEWRMIHDHSS